MILAPHLRKGLLDVLAMEHVQMRRPLASQVFAIVVVAVAAAAENRHIAHGV